QPLLHLIGDHDRRADYAEPAIAAEASGDLPHRQPLAFGQRHYPFAAALALVGFGQIRQGPVGIELAGIDAGRDRQGGDAAVVAHQAVEPRALVLRLLLRVADHDERAGQDLEMVRVAADPRRAALHVLVELARARDRTAG